MIPHAWPALVLALAAYRLTRLGGWDDFPPIYRVRAWLIGERWLTPQQQIARVFEVPPDLVGIEPPEMPGKQPTSEVDDVRPAYDRPLLAHLVHCPFCLGWWVSLTVYLAWLWEPRWALYAAAPFALSGFVGLVSKNLDA
jgi:hypothetical protein